MATKKTMGTETKKNKTGGGTPAVTKTAGAPGGGTGPGMTGGAKPGALITAALSGCAPNIRNSIRGYLKLTAEERVLWTTARNAAIGAEKREAAAAAKAAAAA
jgi:hypothetical protein